MNTFVYYNNSDPADTALIGGKGRNLAWLVRHGFQVPPWYAVTTALYRHLLQSSGIDHQISNALRGLTATTPPATLNQVADHIRQLVLGLQLPAETVVSLRDLHARLIPDGAHVAVRSSAADEDSANASFAGLHDSFLFIREFDDVLVCIRKVWASAFTPRALSFRLQHQISIDDVAVAVVIQQMVVPEKSGVVFTVNPNSGNPHQVVISALYGVGEGLVSGGFDADLYTVHKASRTIDRQLALKTEKMVYAQAVGQGLVTVPVEQAEQAVSCLNDAQVLALTEVATAIENLCHRPQDIEFAIDAADVVHILQTRPVTVLAEYGPAAGNRLVWDNSNIIESYSGPTSPMTFSFIRRAYSIVYHCFAQVMGIAPEVVRQNQNMFENMLGLFRGQVYYNLVNWYRLVQLFPGFNYNKEFLESMMGVREKLELAAGGRPSVWHRYLVELPKLLRLAMRSLANFWNIRRLTSRFEAQFKYNYDVWDAIDFDTRQPHELMQIYQDMEEALLWNWKAPIINDFYVMIFYGLLKKKCIDWCHDESGSLQNDLICGEGGIESTQPTLMLMAIALMLRQNPAWHKLFVDNSPEILQQKVAQDPQLAPVKQKIDTYLELYGFRCMNELKLEEPSLRDNPAFVYQMLQNYLKMKDENQLDPQVKEQGEQTIRRQAEIRARQAIGRHHPVRQMIFRKLLRNARLGVKNRENMRFARTRIYGMLRELLNAIARHFAAEGIIHAPHDIYSLRIDEVWDYIKGTAVTTDLKGLIALRQREFADYRREDAAPIDDHFETYGLPYHRNLCKNWALKEAPAGDGELRGIGCCPGVVRARVKVLKSPTGNMDLAGEILAAARTDPGWVPIFPVVSGILIERGSILSHSAIVAREMGIPTIVAIPGLLTRLSDGTQVEMDGHAGTVRILQ